jgi:hypothetical protein
MTQFEAAQAATLSTRDAHREANKANAMAAIDADPASHDAQVAKLLRSGYHIETQTDTMTQLAKGHRVNHLLHFIISTATLGLWLPVWIVMALVSGEKRKIIARTQP